MALGLVVALALTGVVAFAEEWAGNGDRSITVKPSESQAADLATADIVVDLYRIADVTARTDSHTYDIKSTDSDIQKALDSGDWDMLASTGLEKVKAGLVTLAKSEPLDPETPIVFENEGSKANGVYIMLPHSSSQPATSLKGYSKTIEYTFQPSIVTLPTKDQVDENQHVNSAYGNWITEGTIVLKATGEPRFGNLKVGKLVKNFNGDPQTFVFHVVAVDGEGGTEQPDVYENYISVYYNKAGETAYTELNHIPADITVKVEEVYTGAHDEKSAGSEAQYAKIEGMKTVELAKAFENEPTNERKNGHGIENHFKMTGNGDWHWNATPANEAEGDEVVNAHQDASGETEATDQTAETK